MRPDEASTTPANAPSSPQRAGESTQIQPDSQQAAAELLRSKIETLYTAAASPALNTAAQAEPTQLEDVNPYDRTHASHPQPQPDQWKQYHSAWQTYYQKYYEGYYSHHLQHAKQALQSQSGATAQQGYFGQQPDGPVAEASALSRDEALFDLRQKLLVKVQSSSKKST